MQCDFCGTANRAGATVCPICGQPLPVTIVYRFEEKPRPVQQPKYPTLLKERYQITGCIGKGGFGSVYKARDMVFNGAVVAVKEINLREVNPKELLDSIDTFHREVEVLSDLRHPNLPRMYDHFVEGLHWYLVMEYIEGETLAQLLGRTFSVGYVHINDVLNIAMQLCTVLDYMHAHRPSIIFRDLKPANVMLTPNRHLYLIDFGISRIFKPGQVYDTMALGSPGYASPEQYGKAQTTTRTDIYSLGALMHHMITAADPSEIPFRFNPLRSYRLGYPYDQAISQLDQLIMHMVQLDPSRRPATMELVRQHLEYIGEMVLYGQRQIR